MGASGRNMIGWMGVGGGRLRITNHQIHGGHYKSWTEWFLSESLHDAVAHKASLVTVEVTITWWVSCAGLGFEQGLTSNSLVLNTLETLSMGPWATKMY